MHSFEIRTASELFAAMKDTFEDYMNERLSSRTAVASAMLCWHVADWVYAESSTLQSAIPKLYKFHQHITGKCPSLQIVQDITNGTKHRDLRKPMAGIVKTKPLAGYSRLYEDVYEQSSLEIHLDDGTVMSFEDVMNHCIAYWRSFLQTELGITV